MEEILRGVVVVVDVDGCCCCCCLVLPILEDEEVDGTEGLGEESLVSVIA